MKFLKSRKIVLFRLIIFKYYFFFFRDVNTIFRGNSLISKCIDELMKLVGMRYLHETLKSCVETVVLEQRCCEIDPNRIKDTDDSLEKNMSNLKFYISNVFRSITTSMDRCPQIMCEVFAVLKELAIKFFPENKEVCYYVISGFVFLRFFAPALLNPRLFELTDLSIVSFPSRVEDEMLKFVIPPLEQSDKSYIYTHL